MKVELFTQTDHYAIVDAGELIVMGNILPFAEACYALGYVPLVGWGTKILCLKLTAIPTQYGVPPLQ